MLVIETRSIVSQARMIKTRNVKKDRPCVLQKRWTKFDYGLDAGGTFSKCLLRTYCVSVKIGSF